MHWTELMGWTATALALTGVWLNNRRRRACFVLWLISNTITFTIHAGWGIWSLAARDGVFLLLAAHGWWLWGERSDPSNPKNPIGGRKTLQAPER